jgi:hypothetical protein
MYHKLFIDVLKKDSGFAFNPTELYHLLFVDVLVKTANEM